MPLSARHARLEDEAQLLAWANDPITRTSAFSTEPISETTHRAWFRNRLRNIEGCHQYIIEALDGVPVGQVRFDREGTAWHVDYSLGPGFRGRGLGRRVLEVALNGLRGETVSASVIGRVKRGNWKSQKVFESLGFEVDPSGRSDAITYCSRAGSEQGTGRGSLRQCGAGVHAGPRRPKLLFTGGGGAGTEALDRLLQTRYELHFADADNDARPPSIPADRWHQVPFAASSDFVPTLRQLCGELGVSLLVPGVDEELLPIVSARESMNCEVLAPSATFVGTHLDKLTSSLTLRERGLPVPQTEQLIDDRRIPFPCIVKPRQGRGSRGVAVVSNETELQAHVVMSGREPEEFIVQELLVGQEYTVMMAADRSGCLRAVVPVKVEIKRGITLRAQTDWDDLVIKACAAIHAAQPVAGCYNIQLVRTHGGEAKPFEINPRISTTACLGLAAGVDFVGVYLSSEGNKGQSTGSLLPFQPGLRLKRSWHNEFVAPP